VQVGDDKRPHARQAIDVTPRLIGVTVIAAVAAGVLAAPAGGPARVSAAGIVQAGAPGAVVLGNGRVSAAGAGITPGTRFRVGSITKTFVAVVVLQLAAEGRLALDEPVGRRVPGVPADVTPRELLGHRSGLFDHADDPAVLADPRRRWTPRELVALARRHGLGPRGEFGYSTTNYVALGMLVERVTGRPLETELRARIVRPLGLRRTSYAPSARTPAGTARGSELPVHDGFVLAGNAPRDRGGDDASWTGAGGALVSTAADVAAFYRALLGGRLLRPPQLAAMQRIPAGGRYGLGLIRFRTPCGIAFGHTGNVLGTIAAAWSSPDGKRQAVVLSAFPLPRDAEAAFRRALRRAYCA